MKSLMLLLAFAVAALAIDFSGEWKLNTSKSSYTNMPTPKEMTVNYTPHEKGWKYTARGVSATGEPINASFTVVKDGEEARTAGFPMWDAIVLKGMNESKSTGVLKRQGQEVGKVSRMVSADGKTMTLTGNVTTPDGKKAMYTAVYEKQ